VSALLPQVLSSRYLSRLIYSEHKINLSPGEILVNTANKKI